VTRGPERIRPLGVVFFFGPTRCRLFERTIRRALENPRGNFVDFELLNYFSIFYPTILK